MASSIGIYVRILSPVMLYRLPGTKHLASSQGFDVRLLADFYIVFHAPKTCMASNYDVDVKIQLTSDRLSFMHHDLTSSQAFDARIMLDHCSV